MPQDRIALPMEDMKICSGTRGTRPGDQISMLQDKRGFGRGGQYIHGRTGHWAMAYAYGSMQSLTKSIFNYIPLNVDL